MPNDEPTRGEPAAGAGQDPPPPPSPPAAVPAAPSPGTGPSSAPAGPTPEPFVVASTKAAAATPAAAPVRLRIALEGGASEALRASRAGAASEAMRADLDRLREPPAYLAETMRRIEREREQVNAILARTEQVKADHARFLKQTEAGERLAEEVRRSQARADELARGSGIGDQLARLASPLMSSESFASRLAPLATPPYEPPLPTRFLPPDLDLDREDEPPEWANHVDAKIRDLLRLAPHLERSETVRALRERCGNLRRDEGNLRTRATMKDKRMRESFCSWLTHEGVEGDYLALVADIRRMESEASRAVTVPSPVPDPTRAPVVPPEVRGTPGGADGARLFPFKESFETATGTPRDSGYVEAQLVRADGTAEAVRFSREQYRRLRDLEAKRVVALKPGDAARKALTRLAALLTSWGVETEREKPHVLRLRGRLTVHPAEGAADRAKTLNRFARQAEREARGQT